MTTTINDLYHNGNSDTDITSSEVSRWSMKTEEEKLLGRIEAAVQAEVEAGTLWIVAICGLHLATMGYKPQYHPSIVHVVACF
jgi:hypothetical protein